MAAAISRLQKLKVKDLSCDLGSVQLCDLGTEEKSPFVCL